MALGGARLAAKKQTKRMNATFKYTTRDPTWIEIINKGGMTSGALAVVRKGTCLSTLLLSSRRTPRVPTRTNPRRGRSWAHCGRGAAVMAGGVLGVRPPRAFPLGQPLLGDQKTRPRRQMTAPADQAQ
ncbi:hypothetical protein ColTof3_09646 [Colletotrichum tofieldiae]|nr:hypothetical protein ColTof3_09646 [Colletotrichum tofieldiae]